MSYVLINCFFSLLGCAGSIFGSFNSIFVSFFCSFSSLFDYRSFFNLCNLFSYSCSLLGNRLCSLFSNSISLRSFSLFICMRNDSTVCDLFRINVINIITIHYGKNSSLFNYAGIICLFNNRLNLCCLSACLLRFLVNARGHRTNCLALSRIGLRNKELIGCSTLDRHNVLGNFNNRSCRNNLSSFSALNNTLGKRTYFFGSSNE